MKHTPLLPSGKPWKVKPGAKGLQPGTKRMKSRKRSCPPCTVEQQARQDKARELGCIIAMIRGLDRIPGAIHHINSGGQHGQKVVGQDATVCMNDWSHQGRALSEYGWDADECRRQLGPSFEHEPRAFRETFGGFDALLKYQDEQIKAERLWMKP